MIGTEHFQKKIRWPKHSQELQFPPRINLGETHVLFAQLKYYSNSGKDQVGSFGMRPLAKMFVVYL